MVTMFLQTNKQTNFGAYKIDFFFKQECEQNINRRKRSADEISNKITLTTATTGDLTLGPFYIHTSPGVLKESGRDSDNEGRIKPLHPISYALPLILIAIVILGVVLAIVAKRYRNTNTGRIRGNQIYCIKYI